MHPFSHGLGLALLPELGFSETLQYNEALLKYADFGLLHVTARGCLAVL